jgi:hypothetical protein
VTRDSLERGEMNNEKLIELRDIMMNAPIPMSTRIVALFASLVLLAAVLWLVKKRRLGEVYSPIWVVAAFTAMTVSVWPGPFLPLTRLLGAWSHTSIAVFFSLLFLLLICLSYAVKLSRLSLQVKNLSQELAILRELIDLDESTR